MSYQDIIQALPLDKQLRMQALLAKQLVTERQVAAIVEMLLRDSPGIRNLLHAEGDQPIAEEFTRLLVVLEFLSLLDVPNLDPAGYQNALVRLADKHNSRNAINEVIAHFCLHGLFKSYKLLPLFGDGPDGLLGDEIAVEIKSRYPVLYELLDDLATAIQEMIPRLPHLGYSATLQVEQIKGFLPGELVTELAFLRASMASIETLNVLVTAGLSQTFRLSRAGGNLKYGLIILIEHLPHGINALAPPKLRTQKPDFLHLYDGIWSEAVHAFTGPLQLRVQLFDMAREELAIALFQHCLRNIKNMPDEPRVIVIYAPNSASNGEFILPLVKRYLNGRPSTAVIFFNVTFSAGPIAIHSPVWEVGTQLQDFFATQGFKQKSPDA